MPFPEKDYETAKKYVDEIVKKESHRREMEKAGQQEGAVVTTAMKKEALDDFMKREDPLISLLMTVDTQDAPSKARMLEFRQYIESRCASFAYHDKSGVEALCGFSWRLIKVHVANDDDRSTALTDKESENSHMFAVGHGDLNVTQLLMSYKAPLPLSNSEEDDPINCAVGNGDRDIELLKLLCKDPKAKRAVRENKEANGPSWYMLAAVGQNNLAAVKFLHKRMKAKINYDDGVQGLPLLVVASDYTSRFGDEDIEFAIAEYLGKKAGADVNAQTKEGFSPLDGAAMSGDMDRIKLFLSKGAKVNSTSPYFGEKDEIDDSPADTDIYLQIKKAREICDDKASYSMITPLYRAALNGHEKIVWVLWQNEGQIKDLRAKDGRPWMSWVKERSKETADLLRDCSEVHNPGIVDICFLGKDFRALEIKPTSQIALVEWGLKKLVKRFVRLSRASSIEADAYNWINSLGNTFLRLKYTKCWEQLVANTQHSTPRASDAELDKAIANVILPSVADKVTVLKESRQQEKTAPKRKRENKGEDDSQRQITKPNAQPLSPGSSSSSMFHQPQQPDQSSSSSSAPWWQPPTHGNTSDGD